MAFLLTIFSNLRHNKIKNTKLAEFGNSLANFGDGFRIVRHIFAVQSFASFEFWLVACGSELFTKSKLFCKNFIFKWIPITLIDND